MKKKRRRIEKHGIISVVQSPKSVENEVESASKNPKTGNDEQAEHGIISTVQEPDSVENKKASWAINFKNHNEK